jgi:hypothetical protein
MYRPTPTTPDPRNLSVIRSSVSTRPSSERACTPAGANQRHDLPLARRRPHPGTGIPAPAAIAAGAFSAMMVGTDGSV